MAKNSSDNIDNNKEDGRDNAPPDNATNDSINNDKYSFDYAFQGHIFIVPNLTGSIKGKRK